MLWFRLFAMASLAFCLFCHPRSTYGSGHAPSLFFSDLESGPNTGGESNAGTFVTLRGKGFGTTRGSSTVTIGGGEAGSYRSWSDTQVVFQLGPNARTGSIVVQTPTGAGVAPSFLANNINADPRFINAATFDFHLQADSPAIDAGSPVALSRDFGGGTRPQKAWLSPVGEETLYLVVRWESLWRLDPG